MKLTLQSPSISWFFPLLILLVAVALLFNLYSNQFNLSPPPLCPDCLTESLCTDASHKLYDDQNQFTPGLCQQLKSKCGAQCTGWGPGSGGLSNEECNRLKLEYELQEAWYTQKCVTSGCGQPLPSCCQSRYGSCCLLSRNATVSCLSNLTSQQCTLESQLNPDIIDHGFIIGNQCSSANCSQNFYRAQGSCCTLNTTGGIQCNEGSYAECINSPGIKHAWSYNATCSSTNCQQLLNETIGTCCVTTTCVRTAGPDSKSIFHELAFNQYSSKTVCTSNIARSTCYAQEDACHTIRWTLPVT